MVQNKRLPGDFSRDERVSVPIAAYPGAKAEWSSSISQPDSGKVLGKSGSQLCEHRRNSVEESGIEVIETIVDLIENGRLSLSDFVGLPDRLDLSSKE